jgi:hypothetical protein
MAKKALYHSELVKMGDVQVYVDSDPIESTYKKGTFFVALKIENTDRSYTPALKHCAEAFRGYKGQTVTARATGSDYEGATDARVEIFGAQQRQQQPPPQQRNAAPPQQAAPPNSGGMQRAADTKMPIHGQTVGMAVKTACEFLMASGKELVAANIWPVASEIVRTCKYIEAGNLAPRASGRSAAPATPPPQAPPPPPPPAPAPAAQPSDGAGLPPADDDVPF